MLPAKRVRKQGKVSLHSQFNRSRLPIDLVCLLHLDLSPVPPHDQLSRWTLRTICANLD
jgi:hypothetical protein